MLKKLPSLFIILVIAITTSVFASSEGETADGDSIYFSSDLINFASPKLRRRWESEGFWLWSLLPDAFFLPFLKGAPKGAPKRER